MSAYGGKAVFRHPAALVVVVLGLCAALTVAVVALPFVQFAYRAPALHVSLETANALIALLVAYLVYGRFRSSRRLQDLLLTMSLCTVAGANLLLTALPTALSFGQGGHATDRGATVIRLLAIVMLTAAAVVPRRMGVRDRRTVVGIASIAVLGAVLGLLLVGSLGVEGVLAAPPGSATRPLLDSDPALLAAEALAAVLFDVAAVCLARKAVQHHDELLRWVAAACVVGVFTRIHYLLYPSLYSDFVYTGDLLRLAFYLLMLVGAAREIRSYWAAREEAAVLDDRRRMARDLHDGLTQELTYISSQAQRLVARPEARTAEQIAAAAARAVDEARQAISALTAPVDDSLPLSLQRLADDLGHRHEVKIVTQLNPAATVDLRQADALLRITAEAVRNAVCHGAAERIEVRLNAQPLQLVVIDDGRGFDAAARRPGGFGLTSMQQRAESVGAAFSVSSVTGEGATVQVAWP